VINQVMDVLRDWRSSAFEFEGVCRASLRSALCVQGYGWDHSDAEAESILAECFTRMGAKRPTWYEGQREYLEPRENCSWCSKPLADDLQRSGSRSMYCSDVCARTAIVYRTAAGKVSSDKAYSAAYDAMRRLNSPVRQCSVCSKNFRSAHAPQHCCSIECRAASRVLIPTCTCQYCGIEFRPRMSVKFFEDGRGKFCSLECKGKHQSEERFNRQCVFCSTWFISASRNAKYCSSSCTNMRFRASKGVFPTNLNVRLFDYLFVTLPRESGPPRITADIFDVCFARAA